VLDVIGALLMFAKPTVVTVLPVLAIRMSLQVLALTMGVIGALLVNVKKILFTVPSHAIRMPLTLLVLMLPVIGVLLDVYNTALTVLSLAVRISIALLVLQLPVIGVP